MRKHVRRRNTGSIERKQELDPTPTKKPEGFLPGCATEKKSCDVLLSRYLSGKKKADIQSTYTIPDRSFLKNYSTLLRFGY